LITIALSISFTIKDRIFARKERLAKRSKASLISLWSLGRATSADTGRDFHPLRMASSTEHWAWLFFQNDMKQFIANKKNQGVTQISVSTTLSDT
jgi:hypothetical protein